MFRRKTVRRKDTTLKGFHERKKSTRQNLRRYLARQISHRDKCHRIGPLAVARDSQNINLQYISEVC
ncbi:hypothetical protein KM043_015220 [Ampulex compressa]|nr:hypothetical protein KM043_015220 [Ampulex compressa]